MLEMRVESSFARKMTYCERAAWQYMRLYAFASVTVSEFFQLTSIPYAYPAKSLANWLLSCLVVSVPPLTT